MDSSTRPTLPKAADKNPAAPVNAQSDHQHDWTDDLSATSHIRLIREADWSRNGLGPPKDWDATLRLFAHFVLADSRAACLWWRSTAGYVAIYNEAFAPMCHEAHPSLMGSTYEQGFPELWPYICRMFEESIRTGIGQNVTSGAPLLLERNGWTEEAFFSGSFIPVGLPHQPMGFYNSVYEVTDQMIADRRTSMLNKLTAVPGQSLNSVTTHLLNTLATNTKDIPFVMLYQIRQSPGSTTLQLRGQSGLPEKHVLRVDGADINSSDGLFPEMQRAGSELMFIDCDERFDSIMWGGYEAPSKKIAILPISSSDSLFGFLIIGLNPFRPFDDMCRQFVQDLGRMTSTIVSSVISLELAEDRRQQLESDLAFSNLKLRHLVSHAAVGMCHFSVDGDILWANDRYFDLAGMTAEQHGSTKSFFDAYLEEDLPFLEKVWEDLITGVEHVNAEARLKRTYIAPTGEEIPASIQVLGFPYRDPDSGQVKSVMACTTDISRLKWAEAFHARSAAEATEAKQQQEAFIDVVSHEMRNPMGAIVHCAEAIIAKAEEYPSDLSPSHLEAILETTENANIIMQCAKHQRRILDDVLTLSKLNMTLLSITPTVVEPVYLVSSIVSMFKAEMEKGSIRCKIIKGHSLSALSIDRLMLDASRLTQILINLLTNAIKFVKSSTKPWISISYDVCTTEPQGLFPDEMFWADSEPIGDMTAHSSWGSGEPIYVSFTVRDSGIGLNQEDIAKIFGRFSQANIKTHVTYGGSGLGLYISKQLAERHGGQVGVTSIPGQGATFGFYVKARRGEGHLLAAKNVAKGIKLPSRQLHVLLVEDNLVNQNVLSKQLRRNGLTVDVANHGLEALEILDQHTFDAVLMDSEMPILDGLAATRLIRQKETQGEGLLGATATHGPRYRSRLPIVAVTANVRTEQISAAIEAGSDDVIQKPFKIKELIDKLQSLTDHSATLHSPVDA